jgi:hypothetical protein
MKTPEVDTDLPSNILGHSRWKEEWAARCSCPTDWEKEEKRVAEKGIAALGQYKHLRTIAEKNIGPNYDVLLRGIPPGPSNHSVLSLMIETQD